MATIDEKYAEIMKNGTLDQKQQLKPMWDEFERLNAEKATLETTYETSLERLHEELGKKLLMEERVETLKGELTTTRINLAGTQRALASDRALEERRDDEAQAAYEEGRPEDPALLDPVIVAWRAEQEARDAWADAAEELDETPDDPIALGDHFSASVVAEEAEARAAAAHAAHDTEWSTHIDHLERLGEQRFDVEDLERQVREAERALKESPPKLKRYNEQSRLLEDRLSNKQGAKEAVIERIETLWKGVPKRRRSFPSARVGSRPRRPSAPFKLLRL